MKEKMLLVCDLTESYLVRIFFKTKFTSSRRCLLNLMEEQELHKMLLGNALPYFQIFLEFVYKSSIVKHLFLYIWNRY